MITEQMLDELRQNVKTYLSPERYRHSLGVEQEMRYLASFLTPHLIPEAAVAGLLHDITKRFSVDEQLSYAKENGIFLCDEEIASPALIHAKTGAHFAKAKFPSMVDDEVSLAIAKHTTADVAMTPLSMMLYVADFTEEGRTYTDCIALRKELHSSLEKEDDKAKAFHRILLLMLDASIAALKRQGKPIAKNTLLAKAYYRDKKTLF